MEQQQLTTEQALKQIKAVCANHTGTLQDHQVIQTCLAAIEKALQPKEEKED